MITSHNIYIHVPFCVSKCRYCAFFSHACSNPDWDGYTKKIVDEIEYFSRKLGKIHIPTIFFGGGTPSLIPSKNFSEIIGAVRKNFDVAPDAEITIEANPGTLDNTRLTEFCTAGVNRRSVGVQSFDDTKLKFLGRIHNAHDAIALIENGLNRGIRVSADFIYGLPGEDVQDIIETCNKINKIGITHCSMYELTIEPNTPFGKMNLDMPSNETMADMYIAIGDNLKLPRYEVSNYALVGHECRHNQNVWDGAPYIGIGDGAAGRIYLNNTWYEELGAGKMFQPMTDKARAIERVITGMRTMRGVHIDDTIKKILNIEFAKTHPDVIMFSNDRIAATNAGILVLDDLIEKLVK